MVSKVVEEPDTIWRIGLIRPLALVALMLEFYRRQTASMWEEVQSGGDPIRNSWISLPAVFTVLYLIMVFGGKAYMKDREEFKIKPYIFVYNVYQSILNLVTVIAMLYEVRTNPWFNGLWGNTVQPGPKGFTISMWVWLHYNNKYVELLDTLFMVLRKKNNQISFLHCYHHILLIWAWWSVCKIDSGGDSYFGAMVNSFIHEIMYGYYCMALVGIPCPWKKWITKCQMLQFCTVFAHSCYVVYNGNMHIYLPLAQGFVMLNMLVLFGNFYMKAYGKSEKKKQ